MFFTLSKLLQYLFMPLTIVFLVLAASLVVRSDRWKKRLRWTAVGLLLFFSNHVISNEVMRWWEIGTMAYSDMRPYKLGIVLTGATIPYLEPSDRVYFQRGADRVTHTVQLYKNGLVEKILISGGSGRLAGEPIPEANQFQRAMIMMGVDSTDILIENETRNTHESAVQVKRMLDSLHYRPEDCLLITSAFHMRRSLACYRKVGLALQPFTTDFYAHPPVYYIDAYLIPKVDALAIWQRLIREWVGMVAYKMAGYI